MILVKIGCILTRQQQHLQELQMHWLTPSVEITIQDRPQRYDERDNPMTTFPNSPRLIKGALIGIDPLNPLAGIVVFQYNPETMTRRLEPRAAGGDGDPGEATRLSGPPKETITVSIEIDAADQLEQGNPQAVTMGIHPTLAALEMMLYPKSATVIANTILAAVGTIEILPMEGPFILFVWGPQRVLPVRLTSLNITEEAYDPLLNPIRAKVELSLTVLSYQDLSVLHPGHSLFLAHQMVKEVLATINVTSSAQNIVAGLQL
jgi:hypothetical protein